MANTTTDHDYIGDKPQPKKAQPSPLYKLMQFAASLQVTMVLFALSLILVFMGTLAQKHAGIESVLRQYFYCWVAWMDLNLISDFTEVFFKFRFFGTLEKPVHLYVPFTGGYIIGWAMLINLTTAHAVRFKLSWQRSGIWILHFGMMLLLVGEYVRAEMGYEDRMNLNQGETANHIFDLNRVEFIVAEQVDAKTDKITSIPGEILEKNAADDKKQKAAQAIDLPELPFKLVVKQYMINGSEPRQRPENFPAQATNGIASGIVVSPMKEFSGTDAAGKVNYPAAIVELVPNDGRPAIGSFLVTALLSNVQQAFQFDGKTYRVDLRFKRTYLPYSLTALKIENDYYPGTETPRNYASTVVLKDPRNGEEREVKIWMNNPLRYDGATFYQSSMEAVSSDVKRTGLQVVRNPGWQMPYLSCTLVSLGMLIHFGIKFFAFLQKKTAADRQRLAMAMSRPK